MKFSEILWVIKTLNLEPIQDLEITNHNNVFTILSPTKRIDIVKEISYKRIVHRYIRVYENLDDLSTFFQTDFDKYVGEPDIDIIKLYENGLMCLEE